MGNRANFVIVKDQDWQLYYSHWAGCRMLDALIGGPELALRYAESLRRCEENGQGAHTEVGSRTKPPVPSGIRRRRHGSAALLAAVVEPQPGVARAGAAGQAARPGNSANPARQHPGRRCPHRCPTKDIGSVADQGQTRRVRRVARAVARLAHRVLRRPLRRTPPTVRRRTARF